MLLSELTISRASKWIVVALAGLILLSVHGCWRLHRSKGSANSAELNWQACQQLADQISKLRQQPAMATLDNQSQQELSSSVTAALAEAGSGPEAFRSIDPQRANRIPGTSYERQATQIELRGIEMSALVSVLQNVVTRHTGLHATSIELKPASGSGVGEQSWDVGLTLTRLIYTP